MMVDRGGDLPKSVTRLDPRGRKPLLRWIVCVVILLPSLALSASLETTPPSSGDAVRALSEGRVEFIQQCQQRVGPFVTQSTAYQRLQQAQGQGYGVSGVFPCYGGGGRGYCFNVFYSC